MRREKYLQILDFTLNMPHEILGPVALPHPKRSGVPPPGDTHTHRSLSHDLYHTSLTLRTCVSISDESMSPKYSRY